ncbi:hypothetical protein [Geodermatophilus obscurus]|uniref:hypothetical protein n=1 Tax=Geodermatophilus obscurus TaxID=1861 RepID=UPI0024534C05|nr:hypothetical protein [Geodermatophilus obscurus]
MGGARRPAAPAVQRAAGARDGRRYVSDRPGLGIMLSQQTRAWTVDRVTVGAIR